MGWDWIINQDQWLTLHRDKLLLHGDLYVSENDCCYLTLQGEEKVLDLLMQHTNEPVLLLMLEQFYAERFEITGPFARNRYAGASSGQRSAENHKLAAASVCVDNMDLVSGKD